MAALAPNAVAARNMQLRPAGQETMIGVPFEKYSTVRIGVIGLGNRGGPMSEGWAAVPGAKVVAVCDIRADRSSEWLTVWQHWGDHARSSTVVQPIPT
ncbi:hypothetical protein ABIB48_000114 [Arthrobacter sp. UYCu511]|uniref:hypothetical protein n=1 Tax=Arthrobacter sp. UYCu511 TaxID=3156337 RepID=UPI003390B6E5